MTAGGGPAKRLKKERKKGKKERETIHELP
jgi:hypothetical protein